MEDKLKVEIIPAKPKQRDKKVAVYARAERSNVEIIDDGIKRNGTKYSFKKR